MRLFFISCLLSLFCPAACTGECPAVLSNLGPGEGRPVVTQPGHRVTLCLSSFNSSAEDLLLDASAPDLRYRVTGTDDREFVSGRTSTFGWVVLPLPPALSGPLDVELEDANESLVEVRVRVARVSSSGPSTPDRASAAPDFNAAQTMHRSVRASDLVQAIDLFQQAAQRWSLAGDGYGEALALGGEGESQIELSRYGDAKRTLLRALRLAGNDAPLRAWLLHLAARVLFDQYDGKPAGAYVAEEVQLAEKTDDLSLIAMARTDQAGLAFWLRNPKMEEVEERAHAAAVRAGDPETLALEMRWRAWVEEYYERIGRGRSELNESEAFFRDAGDPRGALDAVVEVAEAISLDGDSYSALTTFSKLDPLIQSSGNSMGWASNLINIGTRYQELNKPKLAQIYFQKAERVYGRAGIRYGLMLSHNNLCEIDLTLHEAAQAVAECRLSLVFAREFHDAAFTGDVLCDLGMAERTVGNNKLALEELQLAARYARSVQDPRYESVEHIQIGEIKERQGDRAGALAEFRRAESVSKGVASPGNLLEARYAVARWYASAGQFSEAEDALLPALEAIEGTRRQVGSSTLQASYFAAERKCYELAIDLAMRASIVRSADEGGARGLEASERSRARSLLDVLSARDSLQGRQRVAAETRHVQAKAAVETAFDHRLRLMGEDNAKRKLELNSVEMAQALADLERSEDGMLSLARDTPSPAPTLSAAAIGSASATTGTAFLEYSLGSERSYLWVIEAGEMKSYGLAPRADLERMASMWRAALRVPGVKAGSSADRRFQLLSARLSCALLPSSVHAARMVIVPDGALATLPFAALPGEGCSKAAESRPLVADHEIVLTPSLSVFLSENAAPAGRVYQGEVAIVADPVFDFADPRASGLAGQGLPTGQGPTAAALSRIMNAGYEASAIQKTVERTAGANRVFLAQGFDASLDTVLSPAMRDYRIWHLATHGVYDDTMPEFSGLVFSLLRPDGSPRFGFLKAPDIAELDISAELIVLSACDSAAGEFLGGEGAMGLSYAFMQAGAKEVISTLWSIDDKRSSALMIGFYESLIKNGGNAAAALRETQLAVSRRPETAAPYYWAAFELTASGSIGPHAFRDKVVVATPLMGTQTQTPLSALRAER
ncbi:CHAT domain-containing protein [Granulicella sibirica]|uniref:CHAT domain-containing protein n=1 Tax=Granulicella sibirica TaxID=2479048 RepID=A0A4V1L520_9BACT|nr:CHAT domain-containing tetratricopeptide repeat protein [Granulicella sibirica]RXH54234.1 hypothetical protein GRAN_4885 [Granulicella sibirica]